MKTEHTTKLTDGRTTRTTRARRARDSDVRALEKANATPFAAEAGVAAGAVSGAAAGAIAGALAGPPGAVAGAVIGGAIGAAAGKAIEDRNVEEEIVEEKLDDATGVTSPNLGAAKPGAPPPRRGTFSAASAGAHPIDVPPTEGDIVPPEREDT